MSIAALLLIPNVSAATLESESVIIDEVQQENLYIFSGATEVNAEVYGDVIVFGGSVVINKVIHGDLTAASGELTINADIMGDLRAASGKTMIKDGHIDGDLILATGELTMNSPASSSGSIMVTGGNISLLGDTTGDMRVNAEDLVIGGQHTGNLVLSAVSIRGRSDFKVHGDLDYTADSAMEITPDIVSGTFTKHKGVEYEVAPQTLDDLLTHGLWITLSSLIMGLVTILFAPKLLTEKTGYMRDKPLASLANGIVFLIVVPVISFFSIIAFFTIPTAIMILLLYIVVLLFTSGLVSLYIGGFVLKPMEHDSKSKVVLRLAIGALLLGILSAIPYLNLIPGALAIIAMGGLMQSKAHYFGVVPKKSKE